MAAEAAPLLMAQLRKAWNDRNPWAIRLRLILALQTLDLKAATVWAELAGMVTEALAEKRAPTAWSHEALHQVQAAAREFARRAGA